MKTFKIGIGGTSASGKSVFSERLREKLGEFYKVKVIHMDAYYKPEAERPRIRGISDGREYVDDNHPLALEMDKIKKDFRDAGEWDVVLLEGLFALWEEEIAAELDLKIYVDCDADERLVRRIGRHMSYGQSFEEITKRYVQAVQPRQRELVEPTKYQADIIINGIGNTDRSVEMILAWMRRNFDGKIVQ